ncbi:hypothetical protein HYS10_00020 [Candidatus Collierbacteria bacterium]|nr:hypothetical protein [Candidatus Collierbacteria bacterium]
MRADFGIVLQVYFISLGLQLVAWPWLSKFLEKLVDRGWAGGRVILTLVIASVIWWLSYLKVPLNTVFGLTGVILVIIGLTGLRLKKDVKKVLSFVRSNWSLLLIEEVVFFCALTAFALIRGFQPNIVGLEKYMDFGFIKSYLASPTLPAPDMWFAGKLINYYSFGHFWASILIRIWGVIPAVGYNMVLAFIFASSFTLVLSIVVNLFGKGFKGILGGVLSGLMVTVGGNSHIIWYLIKNGNLNNYWYADATRFIANSIHEFASYSFVVSDLHAHLLALPVVLLFILFLSVWIKDNRRFVFDLVLGFLLGIMAMANTWDIATYSLLLTVTALLRIIFDRKNFFSIIGSVMTILVSAILTALFWKMGFLAIASSLGIVKERSPLWQLAALWTGHLLIVFISWLFNLRFKILKRRPVIRIENLLVLALGITAVLLIIIPEFVYATDIYKGHPRANTMFKLTFQAFIMMSLVAGWTAGRVFSIRYKVFRVIGTISIFLLFGGFMLFPIKAYESYYGGFKEYRGLDGLIYLKTSDPNEAELIRYLEDNRDGENLVEAVGDSFTEFNTISAYSGVPSVLGWRAHEWLWRTTYDEVGVRDGEVKRFYENRDREETKRIIDKYNLGWIVITNEEREKYLVDEVGLRQLGQVVWQRGNEMLIKIE